MAKPAKIIAEEIEHSPLGASGADRWMNCPRSIGLAKELGLESTAGVAAEEGSAAHEILERCMKGDGLEPIDFAGQKVQVGENEYEVNENMINALNIACNHVWSELGKVKAEGEAIIFIEESMKHSDHDLMYGTVDVGLVSLLTGKQKVKIKVLDYKHGAGVVVEPTKAQTKYYAVLIANRLMQDFVIESFDDIEEVDMTIMQPRIPHIDGVIRNHIMTGPELWQWYVEELVPAMERTKDPNAILQIGEWCGFCPVNKAGRCPAIGAATTEVMTAIPPEQQDGETLGRNIEKIKFIAKMLPQYQEAAFKKALSGEKIFNHKLVDQIGNRVFNATAEAAAKEKFGDEAYEVSFKSPAQIEKLEGGKAFVAQHAYKPQKGLTLAPLSDKRKEQKPLMDRLMEMENVDL
jgi:hypothetical protein